MRVRVVSIYYSARFLDDDGFRDLICYFRHIPRVSLVQKGKKDHYLRKKRIRKALSLSLSRADKKKIHFLQNPKYTVKIFFCLFLLCSQQQQT